MPKPAEIVIFLYTGDLKNGGTNSKVHIKLYGDDGSSSKEIELNHFFTDEFEKGHVDTFQLSEEDVEGLDRLVKIERVEIWKSHTLLIFSDNWFVDRIKVENVVTNTSYQFPMFRWIRPGIHYHIKHLDTSLPQFDEFPDQRKRELEEKRKTYQFDQKFADAPVQVRHLPEDEKFTFDYKWDLSKNAITLGLTSRLALIFAKPWESIDQITDIYQIDAFEVPTVIDKWNSDFDFGRLRVASLNPGLIKLFENVPEKFPITDGLLAPLLEGLTIQLAIQHKRLFYVDLELLEGLPHKKGFILCKPIALFFLDKRQLLMPVAIQLFQQPGSDNPIFTPMDDANVWTVAKMWYNNADAAYHESVSHLGLTHLLMEGFVVAAHRNLSVSHPVFKVLAPHFLYLLNINGAGLDVLLSDKGWINKVMNVDSKMVKTMIAKRFAEWRLDRDGLLIEDLKARHVDDPEVLPGYHFRDDAMLLYQAIRNYAQSYCDLYYTSAELLHDDAELQGWAHELVKERNGVKGGCGYQGIPGNGHISSTDQLAKIITCFIYTCSVTHAAVNFPQYNEYAYPPHYPMQMRGTPPTTKNAKITEKDILNHLPNQTHTFDIMTMTAVLSYHGTTKLGDFEVQYIFDPPALAVVDKFREELEEACKIIQDRNNKHRTVPYEYLDPSNVPNSISI